MGIRTRIVKWITGVDYAVIKTHKALLDAALDKLKIENEIMRVRSNDGLNETYLFDFTSYSAEVNMGFRPMPIQGAIATITAEEQSPNPTPLAIGEQMMFGDGGDVVDGSDSKLNPPKKIKVKPIDVLNELETVPTPFSLALLDEKINILEDKAQLITQVYAKREILGLKERLVNRKKYTEHKAFFDKFLNTTQEKVDKLLSKYELVMKTADIFIPEFPEQATAIMKAYTEKCTEIGSKKPVFYVIAEENMFRKAYEKRDPILLVQSPFGFYWQILGAWDQEMLILSEL